MVTVMLTLERPSPQDLSHFGRAQKYLALKSNATQIRGQLMDWLQERGLADEVLRVGQPTAFNTLFVTSTLGVAEQLTRAPGVVDVRPAEDFQVDLFSGPEELPPPGQEPDADD